MPAFRVRMQDLQFVLNDVLNVSEHLAELPDFEHIDSDIINAVLEEGAKLGEQVLFPVNQSGDEEGCSFNNGEVSTPKGFKQAFKTLAEGGWVALTASPEFDGQQFPHSVNCLIDEIFWAANGSLFLTPNLTHGVYRALAAHGTEEQKHTYLPKMVAGQWTGVMCLTEPHCGTDLGLLRTKAEPQEDGSYQLTGTKIFITSGEHDMTDNIVHLVLARLPDAPKGVKGISMFLVPKFMVNADGSLGERNGVHCGSIEHKMGIHGSCTCVMNYENATGFLVGDLNAGLKAMFTVMNCERLSIGLQGLGCAEGAYQQAVTYAKERLQGRGPNGPVQADKAADPIIVHPDVRRMLLTTKSFIEGARCLSVWVGQQLDRAEHHPDKTSRENAQLLADLFTPIVKAFFTDYGFETANHAMQVFGGHGYVWETGVEQYVRDARIAQIYEGANGIQALDLVRRKLVANKGEALHLFCQEVDGFLAQCSSELAELMTPVQDALQTLTQTSDWLMKAAADNPAEMGAASVEYLHIFGLTALSYMWLKMADAALNHDDDFHRAKLRTASFYMQRVLPRVNSLSQIVQAGSESLMSLAVDGF